MENRTGRPKKAEEQMQLDNEHISGFVNSILFSNDINGYKVVDIESEDGLELITAVGIMPDLEVGEKIEASGKWEQHSTYGEQFSVREYYRSVPDDIESMKRYLGSGVIKGIGEAMAAKIVDRFGAETFHIIENEPERLAVIKGISDKKACEIGEQFAQKAASREAMVYLQGLGLTPTMSMRVYEALGQRTVELVKKDPYIMAEKVDGISFRKADEIARRSGIPEDSPARIRSAIRFVLMEAAGLGHTYLPRSVMDEWLYDAIGVSGELVDTAFDQALMTGSIISKLDEDEESVYLRSFFTAETGTARHIAELLDAFPDRKDIPAEDPAAKIKTSKNIRAKEIPEDDLSTASGEYAESSEEGKAAPVLVISEKLSQRLAAIEKEQKIELSDEQRFSVAQAYERGMVIITGGPGTGKTTIIQVLLELLDQDGAKFALAAPTGKAAKRMEEATGRESRTLHRLLEVQALADNTGRMNFNRNAEHPLEQEYIIVDEMSMVDIVLMFHLLDAIAQGTHLVLLGDKDQLPSVGAGNVLRDMIESGCIPVCRLTHIYRQSGESGIVRNAHRINNGEYPVFDNKKTDFFLMHTASAEQTSRLLGSVVKDRFPKFYPCKPIDDIQVLSPMKKGILGVRALNENLQSVLNPPSPHKKEHRAGETLYREGDKVMQTRNNYEMEWKIVNRYHVAVEEGKGVFNGDTGRIQTIDKSGITVQFDGQRLVTYDNASLGQLELAYAITIHKSQGTESPVVMLPLFDGPDVLMTRNLLYTAVTRAKKYVVILGKEETVRRMVDNDRQAVRYSKLPERIRSAVQMMQSPPEAANALFAQFNEGKTDDGKVSRNRRNAISDKEKAIHGNRNVFPDEGTVTRDTENVFPDKGTASLDQRTASPGQGILSSAHASSREKNSASERSSSGGRASAYGKPSFQEEQTVRSGRAPSSAKRPGRAGFSIDDIAALMEAEGEAGSSWPDSDLDRGDFDPDLLD